MSAVTDALYRRLKKSPSVTVTVADFDGNGALSLLTDDLASSMLPVYFDDTIYKPIYVSQWALEADSRRNDCGSTCVAMHLRARGDNTLVNELRTVDPTGLTNAPQLQEMMRQHGLSSTIEQTDFALPLTAIAPYSILLVNYAPLRQYAQDTAFTGWHWLIKVGPDPAKPGYTLTLDPDYGIKGLPASAGDHKSYPDAALRSAFRPYTAGTTCTSLRVDDVPLAVVPNPPYLVVVTTSPGFGLNIRSGPGTNFAIAGSLPSGTRVTVTNAQDGWLKLGDRQFIASSWTKPV